MWVYHDWPVHHRTLFFWTGHNSGVFDYRKLIGSPVCTHSCSRRRSRSNKSLSPGFPPGKEPSDGATPTLQEGSTSVQNTRLCRCFLTAESIVLLWMPKIRHDLWSTTSLKEGQEMPWLRLLHLSCSRRDSWSYICSDRNKKVLGFDRHKIQVNALKSNFVTIWSTYCTYCAAVP